MRIITDELEVSQELLDNLEDGITIFSDTNLYLIEQSEFSGENGFTIFSPIEE